MAGEPAPGVEAASGAASGAEADRRYMRRALALAEAGWGRVHPNPLAGAVVVRAGEVVGEGAHREYGGPHAEVEALRAAGDRARGATLYVTLEPCAHHGKTPPCADAVREAGIRRLVYAVADPHPPAAGGGATLAAAGVVVESGIEEERARRQNALFFRPPELGRPFVALKFGLTLDAMIAAGAGQRTTITGPDSQREVHRLRSGFDAILVGAGTARVDDPLLTVRHAAAPRVAPIRVVADPSAGLPLDSRLVRSAEATPVRVLTAPDAPAARVEALRTAGAEVVEVRSGREGLDVEAAVNRLWEDGVKTIFCEGGGRLGGSLLRAGLVDRLYLFYAPRVLGTAGVPAFPGPTDFGGTVTSSRRLGEDVLVVVDRG